MVKFPEKQLAELEAFVTLIKSHPSTLNQPELAFFKKFLEDIGARIPAESSESKPKQCPFSGEGKSQESAKAQPPAADVEPELFESDVELDNEGVIGRSIHLHCSGCSN